MILQSHSSTYNLRRENWKDTGRQICIAQYDKSQCMEAICVHQQMNGQRRCDVYIQRNTNQP